MILGMSVRDAGRTLPAQEAIAGVLVLAGEADRGRIIVQFVEAEVEASMDGEDDLGQERAAIGVEQAIEGAADLIVVQPLRLIRREPEGLGRELADGLVLAVDRLALDQDRAQEHQESGSVGQGAATIPRGNEALEDLGEPDPVEEVVE